MLNKVKEYLELVKFEHSIFALPFALCGMLLAASKGWPEPVTYLWVIFAMVGGRTAAMALNRIIDADIDSLNPRTKTRAIPAGKISKRNALVLTTLSLLVMCYSVFHLPVICIYLLPVAIFIIVIYSYTKRFTYGSHFVLGFVLGSAAIGGWLAVNGKITLPQILYGAAVTFWVAGFDILYSIQDADFDRMHHLYSLPAKFGIPAAINISRLCHVLTITGFFTVAWLSSMGLVFYFATGFMALMLLYEHSLIKPDDLSKVDMAFFNVNGIISIVFLVLTVVDKLMFVS